MVSTVSSRIHVALSPWDLTDDYNRHAGVTLLSLLDNSSMLITAHLLYDPNLSVGKEKEEAYNKSCYQKIADKYNCELLFHPIKLPKWVNDIPAVKRFTPGTLLRLYLPDLIKDIDKIIYLDCDTVVMVDVEELWGCNLGGHYLAACLDTGLLTMGKNVRRYWEKKYIQPEKYFNAGVLVLNLNKLRQSQKSFTEIAFNYLHDNYDLRWLDQDVLNWYCQGNYLELHPRFNYYSRITNNDVEILDGCILHYAVREMKPWRNYHGEIDEYYWNYLLRTPWAEDKDMLIHYIRASPVLENSLFLLQKD